jgi:carboxypeptidase Q
MRRSLPLILATLLLFAAGPPPGHDLVAAAAPSPEARYRDAAGRLIGAALASDHAWDRLEQLCDGIGHPLSGSASLERATEWAEKAMREDGLERVRRQPVLVPKWVRGEESAEMIEPSRLRLAMLGLGRSVGTPPDGITADVVVVTSYDELHALPDEAVRGKIVLYDVPFTTYGTTVTYRAYGARRAASRGAVAVLVRSVGPVSLRTPHTGAMAAYVDSFPAIPAAAISVEDAERIHRLLDRGKRVRVKLQMSARTHQDAISHNVIGEIRGRERPDEIVLVGGHLDSWDVGQGAHDDGGGCVIGLEALRLVKQLGLRPRRTLRCVFFTNEENGAKGAAFYDSTASSREKHVAAIESDGGVERPIGFGVELFRRGTDTTDVARTARAAARLREIAPLLSGIGAADITEKGGGADIEPLMKRGVPGIAHRTVMEKYFHWHHTEADMLDKVDPMELRKNVAAMAVLAWVLAEMPETIAPERDVPPARPAGTQ